MEFGPLIEYNMRNIFLEKSCTRCGGETSPRSFLKRLKLNISVNQQFEILYSFFFSFSFFFFFLHFQVEDYQNMLKQRC